MRRNAGSILVVLLAGGLLLAGLARLFANRFAAGDVYPPYSTLRADPLGSRAFYEALDRLAGLTAERSLQPLDRLEADPSATLFILGWTPPSLVSTATNMPHRIQALARDGARVVIALSGSAFAKDADAGACCGREPKADTPGTEAETEAETEADGAVANACEPASAVGDTWLNEVRLQPPSNADSAETPAVRHATAGAALPAEIAWRDSWTFEPLHEAWSVVYERNGRPVAIERDCGRGSIVLCGNSFPLCNEALWRSRATPFLVWLVGDNSRALFLESHHGLTEDIGVMALVRRFRLHGALAGLALLTALFVWQQSAPLIPALRARRKNEEDIAMMGHDMHSGFVSLLKRSVPAQTLAAACVDVWAADQRLPTLSGAAAETRLRRQLKKTDERMRDPVVLYRALCALTREKKGCEP